ncbi:MAG: Crp/Fnr family transcriptional regulator [Myxococcales bacterium]|nr:Crp/Fnr family transcriptional regulator [Myxococcales bacterium]
MEPGGTCILALTSTFNREPYPAWVDAGPQGAGFARLPAPAFRKMFDAEPEFRGFLFGVLSGRVFELMRTLEEAGTAQMEERVARYLTRNADADGVVRASQAGIAAELGTAREVVFRALRALTARGLVRTGRLRIQVLSLPRLRRAAKLAS